MVLGTSNEDTSHRPPVPCVPALPLQLGHLGFSFLMRALLSNVLMQKSSTDFRSFKLNFKEVCYVLKSSLSILNQDKDLSHNTISLKTSWTRKVCLMKKRNGIKMCITAHPIILKCGNSIWYLHSTLRNAIIKSDKKWFCVHVYENIYFAFPN